MSIADLSETFGDDGGRPDERVPPQDLRAEQSVIGSMLLDKDAIVDVVDAGCKAGDYYRPAHEVIHDTVMDLYAQGHPVDAITVGDELTKRGDLARVGGQAYLHQLIQSVSTTGNAGYYAEIVHEKAVLRRLVQAGARITQMGYGQGEGDVEEIVNRAQAEVYAVGEDRENRDFVAASDLLEAVLAEVEESEKNPGGSGLPTGFYALDKLLHGLEGGQMIVVAGRPGSGKTTLATDIARHLAYAQKIAGVVFSLEMGRNELMKRIIAAEATVMFEKMRSGKMTQEDWSKIALRAERISEGPLFIDDSPNMTLVEIRAKARRLVQLHAIKFIVVDYLQLMTTGKKVENRQQEVSEMSRALKLLAKELDVPVIVLSQLNRGPEQRADKRPTMADMRESGAIEQDADVIALVHRIKDDPEREGEADIIVDKHRNGPTGDVTLAFQGHYARFANMAREEGF